MLDYEILFFASENKADFLAAFDRSSRKPSDATQRRRIWWCFDNPNGGAFVVARHGDDIVATAYLGGKAPKIAGQAIAGFEIGETGTDPDHQRKGLFSKLVRRLVAHVDSGAGRVIYGTPNSQSTPGYAKMEFDIVQTDAAWLNLVPNLRHWVPLPRSLALRAACEITGADYVAATENYPRLNDATPAYLAWRFVDAPHDYRFFELKTRKGLAHLALRPGVLGRFSTLLVSEYFLDGNRPALRFGARLARQVAAQHYDRASYAFLQIHGPKAQPMDIVLSLGGVVKHRVLPICVHYPTPHADIDWLRQFQLSDCDIG